MKILNPKLLLGHCPPLASFLKLLPYKKLKTIKHILVLFVFNLSLTTTFGQLQKNTWLIGGSGSFQSYNQTHTTPVNETTGKYTNIDFSASIGYFVVNKLVFGIVPSYSYYKGDVTNQVGLPGKTASPTKYSIGPFARYYFLNVEKQFNILADIRYQVGINKFPIGSKEHGKVSNFSFMAGPEVFFNPSVGMEILLGYQAKTESIGHPFVYQDKLNGFQASVGFQFHLNKK